MDFNNVNILLYKKIYICIDIMVSVCYVTFLCFGFITTIPSKHDLSNAFKFVFDDNTCGCIVDDRLLHLSNAVRSL